jgi:hypothetical protein
MEGLGTPFRPLAPSSFALFCTFFSSTHSPYFISFRSGKGTITHPNGDVYEGSWYEGVKHGYGVLKKVPMKAPPTVVNVIEKYDGFWKDGLPSGKGTYFTFYSSHSFILFFLFFLFWFFFFFFILFFWFFLFLLLFFFLLFLVCLFVF